MSNPEIAPLILSGKEDQLGDSLSTLRKHITEVSKLAGLESQYMHRLRLAVDEVAANIILYGYSESPEPGVVTVTTTIDNERLTVILEDTGVPYDPTQRAAPENLDNPLETREMGGLGIYLAIRNVDEFSYQRGNDNRNINKFVMYRHKVKE